MNEKCQNYIQISRLYKNLHAKCVDKTGYHNYRPTFTNELDIGRSVYHFCNIYIQSNEIHNVVALIKCLLVLRC